MARRKRSTRRPLEVIYDEPVYFCFSASLRISGDDLDFAQISRKLGLVPTHVHRKGERRSRKAQSWKHDLWLYQPPVNETRPLEEHIMALWKAIRRRVPYLRSLKRQHEVNVFCGYRSNSHTAGFEINHKCLGLFTALRVPFGVSVITL